MELESMSFSELVYAKETSAGIIRVIIPVDGEQPIRIRIGNEDFAIPFSADAPALKLEEWGRKLLVGFAVWLGDNAIAPAIAEDNVANVVDGYIKSGGGK